IEKPLIVTERNVNLLLIDARAKEFVESYGYATTPGLNLFKDLLKVDARKVLDELEKGEHELEHQIQIGGAKSTVRLQWMPEPEWLVVEIESKSETPARPD